MTRWTEIRYKCTCMSAEVTVQITERGLTEDVLDFMARVSETLGGDHSKRSPLCVRDKMEYAKIPLVDDMVGRATGGTA